MRRSARCCCAAPMSRRKATHRVVSQACSARSPPVISSASVTRATRWQRSLRRTTPMACTTLTPTCGATWASISAASRRTRTRLSPARSSVATARWCRTARLRWCCRWSLSLARRCRLCAGARAPRSTNSCPCRAAIRPASRVPRWPGHAAWRMQAPRWMICSSSRPMTASRSLNCWSTRPWAWRPTARARG